MIPSMGMGAPTKVQMLCVLSHFPAVGGTRELQGFASSSGTRTANFDTSERVGVSTWGHASGSGVIKTLIHIRGVRVIYPVLCTSV